MATNQTNIQETPDFLAQAQAAVEAENQRRLESKMAEMQAEHQRQLQAEARRLEVEGMADALVADLDRTALAKAQAQMEKAVAEYIRLASEYDDLLMAANSKVAGLSNAERKEHSLTYDHTGVYVAGQAFSRPKAQTTLHNAIAGPLKQYYSRYPMSIDLPVE